jgi:hypothetical protein
MLGDTSGLTVNWTAVTLGPGSSLALHTEYQAFLEASTKDMDSNPNLMVRVDVKAPDAPPKRRGPAVGSRRPPLAPLDSLDSILNAIGSGATALPGFRTLAGSAAKTNASRARALPALPAPPAAAPTPPALAAQVGRARAPARALRASRPWPARGPGPALLTQPAPDVGPPVADRSASSAAWHAARRGASCSAPFDACLSTDAHLQCVTST